jgi:phosphatidylglycerophosphate synthase
MSARSIPDIQTLRGICQGEKLSQDRRLWYVIPRLASIYITWFLLHTSVSALQVTVMSVAAVVAGVVLLGMQPAWIAFLGAVALVIHHVLDKVDGEIARFRQSFSLSGVYLDELGHMLASAGLFLGLGAHLSWNARSAGEVVVILGPAFLGALSMVLVRQNKTAAYLVFARNVLAQPALLTDGVAHRSPSLFSLETVLRDRSGGPNASSGPRARLLAGLRDLVLLVSEYSFVLLLVLGGLILEMVTGDATFLRWLLVAQAALQLLVLASLIWINVTGNVRSECLRLNAMVRAARAEGVARQSPPNGSSVSDRAPLVSRPGGQP